MVRRTCLFRLNTTKDITVLEDYLHMLKQILDNTPDIYFEATSSSQALRIVTAALIVIQTEVAWTALEHVRNLLQHPCLEQRPNPPPSFPMFAAVINQGVNTEGKQIVQNLVAGLAEEPPLPDDSTSMVITSFRSLAALWPLRLMEWLPIALELMPAAPAPARKKFFDEVARYCHFSLPLSYCLTHFFQCYQRRASGQGQVCCARLPSGFAQG
jgi:transportin-3